MAATRIPVEYAPGARERLSAALGRSASNSQVAGLVGAQPSERITVDRYLQIRATAADGSYFYAYLNRSANGITLWTAGHHVPGAVDVAPTSATRLAQQIRTSRALGIHSIFTKATRAETFQLALLGYDAPLRDIVPHETSQQRLPPSLARYETVQQLMRDPAGQSWWQRYGGTPGLTFDPTPGSLSMRQFAVYRRGSP
jgi:hypothetical protein